MIPHDDLPGVRTFCDRGSVPLTKLGHTSGVKASQMLQNREIANQRILLRFEPLRPVRACESGRLVDHRPGVMTSPGGHFEPVAGFPQSWGRGPLPFQRVELGRVDERSADGGD